MAVRRLDGNTKLAINDANNKLHVITNTKDAPIDRGEVKFQ
jgi:hypothetical protein